jgi:hypothetical protein
VIGASVDGEEKCSAKMTKLLNLLCVSLCQGKLVNATRPTCNSQLFVVDPGGSIGDVTDMLLASAGKTPGHIHVSQRRLLQRGQRPLGGHRFL